MVSELEISNVSSSDGEDLVWCLLGEKKTKPRNNFWWTTALLSYICIYFFGLEWHSIVFSSIFRIKALLLFLYRTMQKKYATGRPDQKDLNENLAATQGLAHMITECNRLFEVSLSLSLSHGIDVFRCGMVLDHCRVKRGGVWMNTLSGGMVRNAAMISNQIISSCFL